MDVLPAMVVFGLGLTVMVAPVTSTVLADTPLAAPPSPSPTVHGVAVTWRRPFVTQEHGVDR